jgi:hypothetical protein
VLHKLLSGYITGGEHNRNVISRSRSSFSSFGQTLTHPDAHALVRAKQYEPISVHSLLQGLRINDMAWLAAGRTGVCLPRRAIKRRQL